MNMVSAIRAARVTRVGAVAYTGAKSAAMVPNASSRPRLVSVPRPPEGPDDDAALVAAAREGSRAGATRIWDRYATLVRRVLLRTINPGHDVEDLTQEVFLRFFDQLHRLREPSAVRSYLVGITLHVARSELRRRRVRRFLRLTDDGSVPDRAAPELNREDRVALSRLHAILDRLNVDDRLAFVLRHVEEMELTEIADATECSLATVKRRLSRAHARVLAHAGRDAQLTAYAGGPPAPHREDEDETAQGA